MFRLLVDSHIPFVQECFPKHFKIETYDLNDQVKERLTDKDILVCRSTLHVTKELLNHSHLSILATASSGTNHIDKNALSHQNIQLFSGRGANAPAVCDYVTSCLAYLELHQHIKQKKLAIVGYGAVGNMLYNRLRVLGFELGVYDPFVSTPNTIAFSDLANFPIICLHPNYHQDQPYPSHHLLSSQNIGVLPKDVIIINAARGHIVEEEAILSPQFKGLYCCDVFAHEPDINPELVAKATLCTPHIAGHSIDSKKRITQKLSEQIHEFLKLPIPEFKESIIKEDITSSDDWQNQALKHYNPEAETIALKQTPTAQQFVLLRGAHRFRTDFPWRF